MRPRHRLEPMRPHAALATLAALVVTACGGGVPTGRESAAAGPQSPAGPAGAPAGGGPQGAPDGSPPAPANPQPQGDAANPPQDTSGWARDRNGNLIGPTGW